MLLSSLPYIASQSLDIEIMIDIVYLYMYIIYIYTRNTWAFSHSQTNVDATSQNSYGKNNKGTREY